jgi:hypothetical protein
MRKTLISLTMDPAVHRSMRVWRDLTGEPMSNLVERLVVQHLLKELPAAERDAALRREADLAREVA